MNEQSWGWLEAYDLDASPYLDIIDIKEYDEFDKLQYFDMNPDYKDHFSQTIDGFPTYDKDMFFNTFYPALSEQSGCSSSIY